MMVIEKKIYYCWFGKGELPPRTKAYIASWKRHMPAYEIIEINETNFDIAAFPYAQGAYETGRYAFVSDCARVFYLQTYGGVYFDTDVEVRKDLSPFISAHTMDVLLAQEWYEGELTGVNTSVIVSRNDCKLWRDLLEYYTMNAFVDEAEPTTINAYISRLLFKNSEYKYKDEAQTLSYKGDVIAIVAAKYLMLDTADAFAVHHLGGTWKQTLPLKRRIRRRIGMFLKRVIGKRGFERLWHKKEK
jgi:mannosyltransferase OCH1-like enzyme